jgi:hypothetical protein
LYHSFIIFFRDNVASVSGSILSIGVEPACCYDDCLFGAFLDHVYLCGVAAKFC